MTSRDARDMFAAVALEVVLNRNILNLPSVARESYDIADAMMAERKKRDIARQHGETTAFSAQQVNAEFSAAQREEVYDRLRAATKDDFHLEYVNNTIDRLKEQEQDARSMMGETI